MAMGTKHSWLIEVYLICIHVYFAKSKRIYCFINERNVPHLLMTLHIKMFMLPLITCPLIWFSLFICLFGGFRPTRELCTHMETIPITVKGLIFWPFFMGIVQYVSVLYSAVSTVTLVICLQRSSMICNSQICCWASSAETVTYNDLGLSQQGFFRMQGEQTKPQPLNFSFQIQIRI